METKGRNKKSILEAIGYLFFADFLFRREMVNRKHCYHLMQKDELRMCKLASIVTIIIEIVFLFLDLTITRKTFDQVGYYYAAEAIMLGTAIGMIIASHFLIKTNHYQLMRAICFIFYVLVIIGTTVFMCGNLFHRPESVSFSFLFLLILIFIPSTFLIDNFILSVLGMGGVSIAIFVVTGVTEFGYKYYAVLLLFLLIALMYRSNQVRSTIYQVKEREMHEVLKIQNYTDTLTCALNRRALEELLFDNFDSWKNTNENVALIMFDVDNFKEYNDNFSHLTGDEVLKRVASMASQLCNKNMPNIFRYGGDEFFMVVVGSDRLDILTKSLELLRNVAKLKMKRSKEEELYLTISIGVQMLNNKIDSPAEFISAVDEDLYFAKNNGKACVAFEKKIYR